MDVHTFAESNMAKWAFPNREIYDRYHSESKA
jgi:hypothetical protein